MLKTVTDGPDNDSTPSNPRDTEERHVLEEAKVWLSSRSWTAADRPLSQLVAAKRAAGPAGTVSVVLPALNEEATVGAIVESIRRDLVERVHLVDEILVMDSGCTDRTPEVAAAAGAKVVHRDEILPRMPARPGKGEVLWRSLFAASGEIVAFVDADLRDFDSRFVSGIIGPLLTESEVHLVKAMYDRPLGAEQVGPDQAGPGQGGRVTELVARPLLNLHWPELAGVVQPLGGEYAARRSLLEKLPFPVGYGVELGLLVDTLNLMGLDAIAQVDVGVRRHRNQDGQALGRMAATIYRTAQARLPGAGPVRAGITQFQRIPGGGFAPRHHPVDTVERPPLVTVPEYMAHKPGRVAA